jgi:cell fate (sporulation/competence/biofilm development) regulator YlbF (YheA/YmcA/DUF963 family)
MESGIQVKTVELCEAILADPDYLRSRARVSEFMADTEAQAHYDQLDRVGMALEMKQRQGSVPSDAEVAEFEQLRSAFFSRETAQGFMDARRHMLRLQESVSRYISKTFELGRVPEAADLESSCCGGSCSCEQPEECATPGGCGCS